MNLIVVYYIEMGTAADSPVYLHVTIRNGAGINMTPVAVFGVEPAVWNRASEREMEYLIAAMAAVLMPGVHFKALRQEIDGKIN